MATESGNELNPSVLYSTIDSYPFHEDDEFQGGLRAILGSVQDPEQVEHLTLRAKCYYYARKANTKVDFDGYRAWVERRKTGGDEPEISNTIPEAVSPSLNPSSSGGGIADAPKPATFAEICDMIADGTPIPGIKEIPDTILEGQSSERQASQRKKPWETGSAGQESPSWMA